MFDGATVRGYVPLLSERAARRQIHALLGAQMTANADADREIRCE